MQHRAEPTNDEHLAPSDLPAAMAQAWAKGGPVNGAIFDFDGTLVDTMPMHYEAYRRAFAEVGIQISEAEFYANVGGTGRETIVKLLAGRPSPLTPIEIHARKRELVNHVFATSPITVLETAKLLAIFQGHLPMALASSGSRGGIDVLLDRLDWRKHFSAIITGDDVEHGKPAPDLFLEAARAIGRSPAECVVFEDTEPGLAAAVNAGMRPFDVRATLAPSARGGPS